jgi:hypothetical protein
MCPFCKEARPEVGFCCERAELKALRSVADEVARVLDSEVVMAASIGALDVVETIQHASARLRQVRSSAA